jgi:squamous cell carcinoma antigen recognized by T-cells 3
MDESDSLDALSNVLNALSEKPFDYSLHRQHIQLARSLEGMEDQVVSAMEMFTNVYAAPEEVWLYLIEAKKASVDLGTLDGVAEVLALYERAEEDYLCASCVRLALDREYSYWCCYSDSCS